MINFINLLVKKHFFCNAVFTMVSAKLKAKQFIHVKFIDA